MSFPYGNCINPFYDILKRKALGIIPFSPIPTYQDESEAVFHSWGCMLIPVTPWLWGICWVDLWHAAVCISSQ